MSEVRETKKKMFTLGMILLILALTTIPGALCARPPPSPWPPVEEWNPMSPEQARPAMLQIHIVGVGAPDELTVSPNTPFYLFYRWTFAPTNVAYRLDNGQPVTHYANLQDRTDAADHHITVTMDGATLNPTGTFTATCTWCRFLNDGYEAVAPRMLLHEYYIEFPYGLPTGEYAIYVYIEYHLGGPFSRSVTLHVT